MAQYVHYDVLNSKKFVFLLFFSSKLQLALEICLFPLPFLLPECRLSDAVEPPSRESHLEINSTHFTPHAQFLSGIQLQVLSSTYCETQVRCCIALTACETLYYNKSKLSRPSYRVS